MEIDLFSLPLLPAGPVPDRLAWAYLLRCADGSLYAGWTSDLARRVAAHTAGKGARYTRARKGVGLAWCALLPDQGTAMRVEAALKRLDKPQKEALCAAWAEEMRPRLCAATPADAADIAAVYGWYVRNSTATFAYTEPTVEDWAAEIAAAGQKYPFLIARGGSGALLGYACAHPWGTREAFDWDVETTIYCHPGAVGRGIARPLYAALLEALAVQGVWNAYARIADPNPASERFHARLGFVCQGRCPRTGYKLDRWVGLSTWCRALKKGRAAPAPVAPPPAGQALAALLDKYASDGIG